MLAIIIRIAQFTFLKRCFDFLFVCLLFFGHAVRHVRSYFPDQGWNLYPLQWKQSLNPWTTREVPKRCFEYIINLSAAPHRHCPVFTLSLPAPFQLTSSSSCYQSLNLLWSEKATLVTRSANYTTQMSSHLPDSFT